MDDRVFIRKIESRADVPGDADGNIYTLARYEGGYRFFPMAPVPEKDLDRVLGIFAKPGRTVWEGGYYVSPFPFDLAVDGRVETGDSPHPLLAAMGIRILGLNFDGDMTELAGWLEGKRELTAGDLNDRLAERKKAFFAALQRGLERPVGEAGAVRRAEAPGGRLSRLALDAMAVCFPWLRVEIAFAESSIELPEEEKRCREACEELARRQRELHAEQEESSLRLSARQLEENEKELAFSFRLREMERENLLKKKELELRREFGAAGQEAELAALESDLKLLQMKAACEETESRRAELKRREEAAALDYQRALAEHRKEMKEAEAREELVRFRAELEKARLRAETARQESERAYCQSRGELFAKLLSSPGSLSLIDLVGMPADAAGPLRYLKPYVMAKFKARKDRAGLPGVVLKYDAVRESAASRNIVMGKRPKAVRIGDDLKFEVDAGRGGYLTCLNYGTDGDITLLIPNCFDRTARIEAGRHAVPGPGPGLLPRRALDELGFTLREGGPDGMEQIVAIVSDEPLVDAGCLPGPDAPGFVTLGRAAYERLIDRLAGLPDTAWSVGYLQFYVEK